jgi:hypothetical protein
VPGKAATEYKPQIGITGPNEDPHLALTLSEPRAYGFSLDNMVYCKTDEASATSYENDGFWVFNGHKKGGQEMNGVMVRRLTFNTRHTDPDLRPRFQNGRRILTPVTNTVYGRGGMHSNVSNVHVTDTTSATYIFTQMRHKR